MIDFKMIYTYSEFSWMLSLGNLPYLNLLLREEISGVIL
jgi:hypothetical protein